MTPRGRLGFVLAVLFVTTSLGQTRTPRTPFSCTVREGQPEPVRAEGIAELVADLNLLCTGGVERVPMRVDLQLFLSVNLTSRIVNSSNSASEALLLVGDPVPGFQTPGTSVFQGTQRGANSIVFSDVRFTQPGASFRALRITNIRANASQVGVSYTGTPRQITAFLSTSAATSVPLANPTQVLATVHTGMLASVRTPTDEPSGAISFNQCAGINTDLATDPYALNGSVNLNLKFTEGFPSAFRKKDSGIHLNQNQPGLQYHTESGFYSRSFPPANGLNSAGLAQQGTRLRAWFHNVPPGVALYVTVTPSPYGTSKTIGLKGAHLVGAASDGGAPDSPVLGTTIASIAGNRVGIAPVSLSYPGGSGQAVWEILASNGLAVESVSFGVVVANLPGEVWASAVQMTPGLAPPLSAPTSASDGAPVPRFLDAGLPVGLFKVISCSDRNPQATLVWQNDSTRQVTAWFLGGAGGTMYLDWTMVSSSHVPDWRVVGTADVDGNGWPDLIWQNDTTRQVTVWYMQGESNIGWAWLDDGHSPGWRVVGAADFDGNGRPDLIWQNDTTRQIKVWFRGGARGTQHLDWAWLSSGESPGWRVVGAADFDCDGKPDLLWQNDSTRQVRLWHMSGALGTQFVDSHLLGTVSSPGWTLVGAYDFNHDGKPDLIWHNDDTRQVRLWLMTGSDGATVQDSVWLNNESAPGWRVVGAM